MKIFDIITEDKKTWMKDGVEMCSKDCCGQPITECECGPDCKHCDCYKLNERYGLQKGNAGAAKMGSSQKNTTNRYNAKVANQNREAGIKAQQQYNKEKRSAKRVATGIPNRPAPQQGLV